MMWVAETKKKRENVVPSRQSDHRAGCGGLEDENTFVYW